MSKNKDATTSDNLVDQITRLLNNLPTPSVNSNDPFVIVQHASAHVKLAGSPDATVRRDIIKTGAQALFNEHEARIQTLMN